MEFIKHPQHTQYLGRPVDWDESKNGECGDLSIKMKGGFYVPGSIPQMESAWSVNPEEAIALAVADHSVRLNVFGRAHPPVSMHVESNQIEPEKSPEFHQKMRERLERALKHIAAVADCNGFVVELRHEVRTESLHCENGIKAVRKEAYLVEVRDRIAGRPVFESIEPEGE